MGLCDFFKKKNKPGIPPQPFPNPSPNPPLPLQKPDISYLTVSKNRLIDKNGRETWLRGINWFGAETETNCPHGLWERNYKEYLQLIKELGFNSIRLPFSNDIFTEGAKTSGIEANKNSWIVNLTPLGLLDKIIEECTSLGLRVMLDRHRPTSDGQSALWFTDHTPIEVWLSDWRFLARHYKNNPTVFAFDLHNEPHGSAKWDSSLDSNNWREAASQCADEIHAINNDVLVVVEGVQQTPQGWYWWGGNLSEAGNYPLNVNYPQKIVYSAHDYPASIFHQDWFSHNNYPNNLPQVWETYWAYLIKQQINPVILGEFGTKLQTDLDRVWFQKITDYIFDNRINFFFWSLNPNSSDTGGLLKDDWRALHTDKYQYLKKILSAN